MQRGGPRAKVGRIPTSAGPMPSYWGKFDVCQDGLHPSPSRHLLLNHSSSSTSAGGRASGQSERPSILFPFFFFSPTGVACAEANHLVPCWWFLDHRPSRVSAVFRLVQAVVCAALTFHLTPPESPDLPAPGTCLLAARYQSFRPICSGIPPSHPHPCLECRQTRRVKPCRKQLRFSRCTGRSLQMRPVPGSSPRHQRQRTYARRPAATMSFPRGGCAMRGTSKLRTTTFVPFS